MIEIQRIRGSKRPLLPTVEEVEYFLNLYASEPRYKHYREEEICLLKTFKRYPTNNDFCSVLIKVCVLDSLYSTNVGKMKGMEGESGIYAMAKQISSAHDLDEQIKEGKPEAIELIADKIIINSHCFSFATKYCFHSYKALYDEDFKNPYPIYDKFVNYMLSYFKDRIPQLNIGKIKKFNNLPNLVSSIKSLIIYLEEQGGKYTFRDIDHYLWVAGKFYFEKPKK